MIVSKLQKSLANILKNDAGQGSALGGLLRGTYGSGDLAATKIERLAAQCSRFLQLYGDGPVGVLRAPARINLLGEHIDYVSYLSTASLTVGSREHDMILLFRPAKDGRVRGATTLDSCDSLVFALSDGPPPGAGRDWESYLYGIVTPEPHWGNYVKGAVHYARMHLPEKVQQGFDFVVDSTIPAAGGASSSSALTVLAGAAIRCVNRIPYEAAQLAQDSARAEWYVGTRGGSMDHITICLARQMNAVHISYADGDAEPVPMTVPQIRWLTFFSHPANKGREVMLEYNERAAVSRILIPALIEEWATRERDHFVSWNAAVEAARGGSGQALEELERLVCRLPEKMSLAELEKRHPKAFGDCRLAFPTMVSDRWERPLAIRIRALHHLGEVRRVNAAVRVFAGAESPGVPGDTGNTETLLRRIGVLLNASHESLRDLYTVSTPEVEQLRDAIVSDPEVYGARLMGGGFGGNVLALTTSEHVPALISRIQSEYYGPRGRDCGAERAAMISTPGDGLSPLDPETAARSAVETLNVKWRESASLAPEVCRVLDDLDPELDGSAPEVWPIIVAAGKGARARASGLDVPKPLAKVGNMTATRRVLSNVAAAGFRMRPPVVIVSPETAPLLRQDLADTGATFVMQPRALGTGDAVLCVQEIMAGFTGRALVIWGTQPVLRTSTVRRTLRIAAIFPDYDMVVPTVAVENPYAPLMRDHLGHVTVSRESHIERAPNPGFAETNVGLFVLWSETMFRVLSDLRLALWQEPEHCYDRPSGELGFPNEVITRLAGEPGGVLASPIADPREVQGIKTLSDIALCEAYIDELTELQP
jgi:galactokinase/CTP:molybdopterin cytidylyltransferase MocA